MNVMGHMITKGDDRNRQFFHERFPSGVCAIDNRLSPVCFGPFPHVLGKHPLLTKPITVDIPVIIEMILAQICKYPDIQPAVSNPK